MMSIVCFCFFALNNELVISFIYLFILFFIYLFKYLYIYLLVHSFISYIVEFRLMQKTLTPIINDNISGNRRSPGGERESVNTYHPCRLSVHPTTYLL